MTVAELIKLLQKHDPEARVTIESSDGEYPPRPVTSVSCVTPQVFARFGRVTRRAAPIGTIVIH